LGSLQTGSTVNLEIDTVARYVERMLRVDASLADDTALKAYP
jgi:riboflavin synthase alpha subunit